MVYTKATTVSQNKVPMKFNSKY